jgi:hypothetical protein
MDGEKKAIDDGGKPHVCEQSPVLRPRTKDSAISVLSWRIRPQQPYFASHRCERKKLAEFEKAGRSAGLAIVTSLPIPKLPIGMLAPGRHK